MSSPPDTLADMESAYLIGDAILMLKGPDDWYAQPSETLNPRITIETRDAFATERAPRERGVTIPDPVTRYDGTPVCAFLDSEGNKLWFCSVPDKGGEA